MNGYHKEALRMVHPPPVSRVFVLCLFVAVGCSSAPESSSQAEVSDSAGLRIVHSRALKWERGEEWSVPFEPVLTIGTLNGSEEYQFVDVSDATRRTDGSLVVVDRGAKVVRIFDAAGDHLRTLGGPGSGPGEFQDPGTVLLTRGDTVAVWDSKLFRLTRFDEGGGLSGVETLDLGMISKAVNPPLYPGSVEPLSDGGFLVRLLEKSGKGSSSGSSQARSGVLRVAGDLGTIDTLMFFGDTTKITVDAPFGPFPVAPPLATGPGITHEGNPPRICIGEGTDPQIRCIGPDGETTLLRWDSEPRPVSEQEISKWRESNLDLFGQKLLENDVLQMLEQVPIPSVRPHYSQITLDQEENLWVSVGPTERTTSPSEDYLVFDPAGSLLGVTALPPIRVLEIGHDYVLGVYRDDLEVEYVHLYELRKPFGSFE